MSRWQGGPDAQKSGETQEPQFHKTLSSMCCRRNVTVTGQFDGAGATEELFLAPVHDLGDLALSCHTAKAPKAAA
jgi:hypothetical protein